MREDREQHCEGWAWLVVPPLVTPFIATAWYALAFFGLGYIGIIFYFLTPIICAVWAFRVCWRLARSVRDLATRVKLVLLLFALELFLIVAALLLGHSLLLGNPPWD